MWTSKPVERLRNERAKSLARHVRVALYGPVHRVDEVCITECHFFWTIDRELDFLAFPLQFRVIEVELFDHRPGRAVIVAHSRDMSGQRESKAVGALRVVRFHMQGFIEPVCLCRSARF